jgi:hypothetical protein
LRELCRFLLGLLMTLIGLLAKEPSRWRSETVLPGTETLTIASQ